MVRSVVVVALAAAALACGCEKKDGGTDMPAAKQWNAPSPVASQTGAAGSAQGGMAMGGGDPHAGMDMGGGDPHGGMNMGGGDPHGGMNMGGGDPHAGMDMGGGEMAMPAPDPNRPIDQSKFLRGVIDGTAKTKPLIKPGAILFIAVRPIDPKTGQVIGSPLAVDRIDVAKLPVPFELTEARAMVAGTQFAGDVVIEARGDGDGEARSKEPGDVVGSVRARIPATELRLELDSVL